MKAAVKIAVLLSAYNGEAYIKAQLDSILSQTEQAVCILVRDDGSTDRTAEILKAYESAGDITLISGENLGFKESFHQLLLCAPEADYYAFSDQDDLWLPDKLSRAVSRLAEKDGKLPLLYHGAYMETDEALCPIKPMLPPEPPFCFQRALTENVISGFSMVINGVMRETMLRFDWSRLDYHDWLAGAIAFGFGEAVLDGEVSALHRRTDRSLSRGSRKKDIGWFASAMRGDSNMKRRNDAFLAAYESELPEKNRLLLARFADPSLRNRLWRAFYPSRWRYRLPDELAVRLAMLMGTL